MTFKLHFNRINMQRGNPNVWTVHTSKKCIPAAVVKCYVPLETKFNPTGRQPRAFLCGEGNIYLNGSTVYIINSTVVNYMSDDDYFEAIEGKEFK
jgi:hypothetical protein